MESTLSSYTLEELHQHRELTKRLLDYHEANLKRVPETETQIRISIELSLKYGYQDLKMVDDEIAKRNSATKNEPQEELASTGNSHAENTR